MSGHKLIAVFTFLILTLSFSLFCEAKCFWNAKGGKSEGQADAEAVETTAYGLLNALSVRDKETAKKIANWLTEQRGYGGGFRSTQVGDKCSI